MNQHSVTLPKVGRLCTGCGVCRAAAPGGIEMSSAGKGYLRPRAVRPLSPEEDQRIADICPGLALSRAPAGKPDHPVWGPIIRARVGQATDPALRHKASSGGALSAVLLYLLETGLVDRVVQTAANPLAPIENMTVESTTAKHVFHAAGSRYAPSAPLSEILQQLDRPGRFAFVGKPCDVAALRAYARHNTAVRAKVPYLISFFCAGIPSLDGTRAILERLGVAEDDVAWFRYRGDGWPGFATASTRDGRMFRMSYTESWGSILSRHLQFRCKVCPDGSGGFADLVCADARYGDEQGYPKFQEAEGRSLVITRTPTGEDIVRAAVREGYLELAEVEIGEIAKMQPYQARRKQLVLSRLAALALFGHTVPRFRGLSLWRCALMAGLWRNARSFIGTVVRIVTRRLEN
jgi:coenzyme F420 hydrogenase subunit beta